MRRLLVTLVLAAVVFACGKKEAAPPAASSGTNTVTATASSTATTSTTTAPAAETPSLISFSSGALIVQKPQEYSEGWSAFWLLDDKATSGWATPENSIAPQTIVIALPERTQLDRLSFDTGSIDGDGRG
ncbi:MAG: hypothetical protein QOI58_4326, partial [Thermoanaerobaculia bacterium]|nr:hypothetical protein [Thermoanaerobaculia bacterium]